MSKYLEFFEIDKVDRKTKIVEVHSVKDYELLGEISFWPAWRQYTFQPRGETIFDVKCLNEITDKLAEMNAEIRKEWRKRKALKGEAK